MDLQEINQGLSVIAKTATQVYEDYHTAKASYESLDKQEKSTLAKIASRKQGSEAARTREALSDPEYVLFEENLSNARHNANQYLAQVKGLEARLACYQSLSKNYLKEHQMSQSSGN